MAGAVTLGCFSACGSFIEGSTSCQPASDASIAKLFSLEGRVALVTGGSKGLGEAIARGLAQAGCEAVVITSRSEGDLKAACERVRGDTVCTVEYIVCDLSEQQQAATLGPAVLSRFGRCDIFVNNAGVSSPGTIHKGVKETIPNMDSSWDTTIATNLTAGVLILNSLAPAMVAQGYGRVVHVSSIGGLGSSEGRSAYTASKAALIGIGHTGALELGPYGVTVNTVCPGPFLTDMPRKALTAETQQAIASKVPLRRWGRPDEMVGPLLMLCSEAGSYVNGAVLRIDGGLLSRAY